MLNVFRGFRPGTFPTAFPNRPKKQPKLAADLCLWECGDWQGKAASKSEARSLYKRERGPIPSGSVFAEIKA